MRNSTQVSIFNKNPMQTLIIFSTITLLVTIGLSATAKQMEVVFQEQYASQRMWDLQVVPSFALTEEVQQSWYSLDFIEQIRAIFEKDQKISVNSTILASRFRSIPTFLEGETFHLIQGAMPEKSGECVVSPGFVDETGVNIGDIIQIIPENQVDSSGELSNHNFTIVGVGYDISYLSVIKHWSVSENPLVTHEIYVLEDNFLGNIPFLEVVLPEEAVENTTADSLFMQEDYLAISEMQRQANMFSELPQLEEEFEGIQLEMTWVELQEKMQIEALEQELNQLELEILEAWENYQGLDQELSYIQTLEDEFQKKMFQIQEKEVELQEILEVYRKSLQESQRDMELIQGDPWIVLDRTSNISFTSFYDDLGYFQRISSVLSLVFYVFYALVSFFTLSRLLEEERGQIGTYFALGYKKSEVFLNYVKKTLTHSSIAVFLAVPLSFTLVPWIFYSVFQKYYYLPQFTPIIPTLSQLKPVFFVLLQTILSILLPYLLLLRHSPVELLRPKAPVPGKKVLLERNYTLWNELNFNQKIAVRSLFRHKIRFLVQFTVIGLSCGLLVVALALQDSFTEMAKQQYNRIYLYSMEIDCYSHMTSQEKLEIQGLLSEYQLNQNYSLISAIQLDIASEFYQESAEIRIFDSKEDVNQRINLRLSAWRPIFMPETGLVLSKKLAEALEVSLGDSLRLTLGQEEVTSYVSAVVDQYEGFVIFANAPYLQEKLTEMPADNRFLLQIPDNILHNPENLDEFQKRLLQLQGVEHIQLLSHWAEDYTASNNLIIYLIKALLPLSCILLYYALQQLCYTALFYRRGELATLKVLGLLDRELSAYVYRENIFYTFFGGAFGMFLGQNIYQWLIKELESPTIMLYRSVSIPHYLQALGMTVLLALLVNILSHFQLKKLNMVEQMKFSQF